MTPVESALAFRDLPGGIIGHWDHANDRFVWKGQAAKRWFLGMRRAARRSGRRFYPTYVSNLNSVDGRLFSYSGPWIDRFAHRMVRPNSPIRP